MRRGVANAFGRVIFNVEQRFRHGAGRRSERMFIMIAPSRSRVPDLLRSGGKALCFKANLSCPRAAEIAGMHGFDALWISQEHVPTDRSAMENFIRAEFGGPGL